MPGIKTLELDPTKKNIYNTLVANAVGRNKNLWQFASFCSAQVSRCSIALDAEWGMGKTFFLKQLKMLFDLYDLDENEQREIEKTFSKFRNKSAIVKKLKPHVCVYYDAWLNDNAEDPMQSILYCLIKHKSDQFLKLSKYDEKSKKKIIAFLNDTKEFVKNLFLFNNKKDLLLEAIASFESCIPFKTKNITESAKTSNPTRGLEAQKSFHDAFSDYLNKLIPHKDERLLILVDELDRCKPSYAVQLLERIKHYLSNDRITFVFAVNKDQLQHTIRAFYGEAFDAYRYLNRFFYHNFILPSPDIENFMAFNGLDQTEKAFDFKLYADVCVSFIKLYDLSLREAIRYWQWVSLACHPFKNEKERNDDISWKFVMYIIVPIIMGLRLCDKNELDEFLNGKKIDPLLAVLKNSPVGNSFIRHPEQALQEKRFDPENMSSDILIPAEMIYTKLFDEDEFEKNRILDPLLYDTSPFEFNQKMREMILSASNLMADFIKFDTNTEETAHG